MLLDSTNYSKGFLIDEELMAGVTEDPTMPGLFVAFVIKHTSGQYLGYQPYKFLDDALDIVNSIPRKWAFEKIGGCGGGKCGKSDCGKGKCENGKCCS